MSTTVPHHVPPRISQTTVIDGADHDREPRLFRQYHARRRPITSSSRSCWLSAPKRLGHGISLRKIRSAKPRNTITTPSVAEQRPASVLQPLYCLNQMKSAGLVSSATAVAARVRRRHWSASSVETAACGRTNPASGCSAVAILGLLGRGGPIAALVSARLSAFVLHPTRDRATSTIANAAITIRATARSSPTSRSGSPCPPLLAFTSAGQDVLGIVDAAARRARRVSARRPDRRPLRARAAAAHRLAGPAARARVRLLARESDATFALDRLKAVTIGAVLTGLALAGLVLCARAFPSAWPLVAGSRSGAPRPPAQLRRAGRARAGLQPLPPARGLRAARRRPAGSPIASGVPVREVLVADASRRTTKLNAYVSGLGATRRVVLYDTLVEQASEPEILTVVAHELGHRRFRHVAFGTAIAMAGERPLRASSSGRCSPPEPVLDAIGATGPGDRTDRGASRCSSGRCSGSPARRSRRRSPARWEYACDRFAVEQTGDLGAFESGVRPALRVEPSRPGAAAARLSLALLAPDGAGAPCSGAARWRPWLPSRHDQSDVSHQRRTDRDRALPGRRAEDGRELHQARRRGLLRRPDLPPRDPRLHDPGRLPARAPAPAAPATSSRTSSTTTRSSAARSRWRTPARTRTAASSSSSRPRRRRGSTASTPSSGR